MLAATAACGTVATDRHPGPVPGPSPSLWFLPTPSADATVAATPSVASTSPPPVQPTAVPEVIDTQVYNPGADAYYPNCAAARAAGAAPLHRGDPGYSRKLDRDGDGVACE